MSKLTKYASVLAELDNLGLKTIAQNLANNPGIKALAQTNGLSSRSLASALKEALQKDLLQIDNYKLGLFHRVDMDKLSEEEKKACEPIYRAIDSRRSLYNGIADLEFMRQTAPRIYYQ